MRTRGPRRRAGSCATETPTPRSMPPSARRFGTRSMPWEPEFEKVIARLLHGDFSALEPMQSQILEWAREGRFAGHPDALAEALSAACFVGRTDVAEYLLASG